MEEVAFVMCHGVHIEIEVGTITRIGFKWCMPGEEGAALFTSIAC